MSEPKPKLPPAIIIMNVIMIILIIVICILTFSLAYSNANQGEPQESSQSSNVLSDTSDDSSAAATTTTTKSHTSVSMTKRSTEPTEPPEPVEITTSSESADNEPTNEPDETTSQLEQHSTTYSKDFFANDLFIGDSITTGLYAYSKLDMKNVAAGIGYTPYKAYTKEIDLYDGTSATALDYAIQMQPERIYIMLGSNGLTAAAAMEDSYRTLIEKLQEGCPDSEILLISVTPVTSDSSAAESTGITNQMVIDFNTYIKSVSVEYGLKYLDVYTLVINDDGYFRDDYAEADGLHFMGATYDVMLSYIQTELS